MMVTVMFVVFILLFLDLNTYSRSNNKIPLPNPSQLAWQEAELGALFSYDLHVFDGEKYDQSQNRIMPIPDYQIFNPKHLDTDQWIRAVKAAGISFAILTATHETGFALYQSDVNPYCLKAVKWRNGKGDIVRDFVRILPEIRCQAGDLCRHPLELLFRCSRFSGQRRRGVP